VREEPQLVPLENDSHRKGSFQADELGKVLSSPDNFLGELRAVLRLNVRDRKWGLDGK
jgi:hypothetical protein